MAKGKISQVSRPDEQTRFFDGILSQGNYLLVTQKLPSIVVHPLPQTTCYFGIHCDHKGQPEPGTYRFSVERKEHAMSATRPIGIRGVQNLSTVLRSPTLMGHGKGGEVWMCVTCYEALLDGRLYRNKFGDGREQAGLHQLIQWLHFIVPETRSLPGFPGIITLTSPQRHTVYLWVAVHLWVVYLCENLDVKKLLDDGVYVEKAFPRDLFPALNSGEALYLDAETRDYRGYSPSGKSAELNWSQVLEEKLSDSLKLSDELVEFLENEDESQEGSFDREEFYENDESQEGSPDEGESHESGESREGSLDRGESCQSDEGDDDEEGVSVNNTSTKPPTTAKARSTTPPSPPSAGDEPVTRGKKRGRSPLRTAESAANCPREEHDADSESEERRGKRAKLAWKAYLRGTHYS